MAVVALEPELTALDRRVLAAVPAGRPGRRASAVAGELFGKTWRYGTPAGRAGRRSRDVATVRGILRGFEHLERVTGRGGWWRAL